MSDDDKDKNYYGDVTFGMMSGRSSSSFGFGTPQWWGAKMRESSEEYNNSINQPSPMQYSGGGTSSGGAGLTGSLIFYGIIGLLIYGLYNMVFPSPPEPIVRTIQQSIDVISKRVDENPEMNKSSGALTIAYAVKENVPVRENIGGSQVASLKCGQTVILMQLNNYYLTPEIISKNLTLLFHPQDDNNMGKTLYVNRSNFSTKPVHSCR